MTRYETVFTPWGVKGTTNPEPRYRDESRPRSTTYVEPVPASLPFQLVGQRVLCEWPEEGTDVPVDVTVGALRVGSFRCLRGLSFSFGGSTFPLSVFHSTVRGVSSDMDEPGLLASLRRLHADPTVFVVEGVGREPFIAFDVSTALKAHLGLVQTKTVDGIPTLIWPDGSAHDLF
jgi:hypothetical protein